MLPNCHKANPTNSVADAWLTRRRQRSSKREPSLAVACDSNRHHSVEPVNTPPTNHQDDVAETDVQEPAKATNTATKDRMVEGLDSVSTNLPARQRRRSTEGAGSAAAWACGARQVRQASQSRKPLPPKASGTQPGHHPGHAEGGDTTINRVHQRRAQSCGQASRGALPQAALDPQQANRSDRRSNRQADPHGLPPQAPRQVDQHRAILPIRLDSADTRPSVRT